MIAGLPEVAVRVTVWPASSADPGVTPVMLTLWVAASSATVWLKIGSKKGGSFTGVTVIITVVGADVRAPSLTVKVKLSEPLKLGLGV